MFEGLLCMTMRGKMFIQFAESVVVARNADVFLVGVIAEIDTDDGADTILGSEADKINNSRGGVDISQDNSIILTPFRFGKNLL